MIPQISRPEHNPLRRTPGNKPGVRVVRVARIRRPVRRAPYRPHKSNVSVKPFIWRDTSFRSCHACSFQHEGVKSRFAGRAVWWRENPNGFFDHGRNIFYTQIGRNAEPTLSVAPPTELSQPRVFPRRDRPKIASRKAGRVGTIENTSNLLPSRATHDRWLFDVH